MAIVRVQGATQVNIAASSNTALTISLTGVAAGNALVLTGSIFDQNNTWTITNVTDGGDTFVTRSALASNGAGTARVRAVVAYAVNVAGGDVTVSVNLAGTSGASQRYYCLGLEEYSGVATSTPEDTFDGNDSIDLTATDISAGPITTTDAGALLVGAAADLTDLDAALNFASPTSWTNHYRQNDGVTFIGFDAGSWLPGGIQTTYTAQWAHDNAADDRGCGVVVALKAAVGGGGSTAGRRRMMMGFG
jgi:hypothetical protein